MNYQILTHLDRTKSENNKNWSSSDIILEITNFNKKENILFPITILKELNVIQLIVINKKTKYGIIYSRNSVGQWIFNSDENHEKIDSVIVLRKIQEFKDWVQLNFKNKGI